jgi:hypothetical protein
MVLRGPTAWESRSLPGVFSKPAEQAGFFFVRSDVARSPTGSREGACGPKAERECAQPRASGGGPPRALSNVTAGSIFKASRTGWLFLCTPASAARQVNPMPSLRMNSRRPSLAKSGGRSLFDVQPSFRLVQVSSKRGTVAGEAAAGRAQDRQRVRVEKMRRGDSVLAAPDLTGVLAWSRSDAHRSSPSTTFRLRRARFALLLCLRSRLLLKT